VEGVLDLFRNSPLNLDALLSLCSGLPRLNPESNPASSPNANSTSVLAGTLLDLFPLVSRSISELFLETPPGGTTSRLDDDVFVLGFDSLFVLFDLFRGFVFFRLVSAGTSWAVLPPKIDDMKPIRAD
jgi:hypothetical protein